MLYKIINDYTFHLCLQLHMGPTLPIMLRGVIK